MPQILAITLAALSLPFFYHVHAHCTGFNPTTGVFASPDSLTPKQRVSPGVVCTEDMATLNATVGCTEYKGCSINNEDSPIVYMQAFSNVTALTQAEINHIVTGLPKDDGTGINGNQYETGRIRTYQSGRSDGIISTCLKPGQAGYETFQPSADCFNGTLVCDNWPVADGTPATICGAKPKVKNPTVKCQNNEECGPYGSYAFVMTSAVEAKGLGAAPSVPTNGAQMMGMDGKLMIGVSAVVGAVFMI